MWHWSAPELPRSVLVTFVVAGLAVTVVRSFKRPNLHAIPTVGSSGWLGSWGGAIRFLTNAGDIIQEGYSKHKGGPFKVATLHRWVVFICSRKHVEELRSARDDEVSFIVPAFEDLNAEFLMESEILRNRCHFTVIRSQLTRNLGVLFPEVQDEVVTAFDEVLGLEDNEWKSVPTLTTIQQIMSRVSNRAFVGLPLCRNQDYMALNIRYAIDPTIKGVVVSIVLGFFPEFLKPLITGFTSNIPGITRQAAKLFRPIVEERWKYLREYGSDWTEKPKDFLSWLMDEAGPDVSVETLTDYVLGANFAAIHTSSNVFINALYNLAANPQYVQPLREEVETIVEKEGWSKASLGKMRRVDSFFKEATRMENTDAVGLMRKTSKDFMFSDGTLIPKGTRIYAAVEAIHRDDVLYENPEMFDPFRFANMDDDGAKHYFATTSPEHLSFGHGRHACPGRFFATMALKTMLAHIVTTYDVKLEGNTARPQSLHFAVHNIPNPMAKVMFRRRTRQDAKR